MNSKSAVILVVVLALVGWIAFSMRASTSGEKMQESTGIAMEKSPPSQESTMMEKPDAVMKNESRYVDYTNAVFDSAKEKKRVYFFHASWCPTCKTAHAEISGNPEEIPGDVVLFKTDYDSNPALKKQYGITYQHTFVLVDSMGKEVKKWNGGGLAELVENTK